MLLKSLQSQSLLHNDDGVIHVPFLVKGRVLAPPRMTLAQVQAAFANAGDDDYVKLPNAQLLRERVIDRQTLRPGEAFVYQVMPALDAAALIELNTSALAAGPYALSVDQTLSYLGVLGHSLQENVDAVLQVRELMRATSEYPDAFLDASFAAFAFGLDASAARAMIDAELAIWGKPGAQFLDGWVEVPGQTLPDPARLIAGNLPAAAQAPFDNAGAPTLVRAMPTRQLHITAGNAPSVPLVSALRLLLSKSVGVIKLPAGATLTGALFAIAAQLAEPDHPLTRNLSVVYWRGGDEAVEQVLLAPGAFDRIVVWGAPGSVSSIQSRALFTKVIALNPRYGASLIGREAFAGDLTPVAAAAAQDSLINNQKACNASFVHYVEGDAAQASAYADALLAVLNAWDTAAPQPVSASARGQLKRMRRGKYAAADWRLNQREGEFASGLVIMPDEFDFLDHPLCRFVVVRRLDDLEHALEFLHPGVSTVGVYPEARRAQLRDRIAARGVSNILPIGSCDRLYPGMPHDGMLVLSELVDWKSA